MKEMKGEEFGHEPTQIWETELSSVVSFQVDDFCSLPDFHKTRNEART